MPTKPRIIIVSFLILLGGALFYYCAAFYPLEIATQVKAVSATVAEPVQTPEPAQVPVQQTSTDCVEQNQQQDKPEPVNESPPERKPRPRSGAI